MTKDRSIIEAEWQSYRRDVLPTISDAALLDGARQIFFAGALAAYAALTNPARTRRQRRTAGVMIEEELTAHAREIFMRARREAAAVAQ